MSVVNAVAGQQGPDGLGILTWVITVAMIVAVVIVVARWTRTRAGRELGMSSLRWFAGSPFGAALGMRAPAEGRRIAAEIEEAAHEGAIEEMEMALENGIRPRGCLVLVVPDATGQWIREHATLAATMVARALSLAETEAFVSVNARNNPRAGRAHQDDVRRRAADRVTSTNYTIGYITSNGTRVHAVLAETREYAQEVACRRFADELPTGTKATSQPIRLPTRARETDGDEGADLLIRLKAMQDGAAATADDRTRFATATDATVSASATERRPSDPAESPDTALVVTLLQEAGLGSAMLDHGASIRIGRAEENDLVVQGDLSVSKDHLVITSVDGGRVQVEANGRTGTWVSYGGNRKTLLRAGESTAGAIPAVLILGDARTTLVAITKG